MADHQNKLGNRLSIADLNDIEYALEYTLMFDEKRRDALLERLEYLRKLFHQLRTEGERGGYDEWIISEILS